MAQDLFTVGHGTLEAAHFVELLQGAGVSLLVDIRIAPGSRRLPQFNKEDMEVWLPRSGIGYHWEKALGGRRKPDPGSVNLALRNEAFRGYADYMATPAFSEALDEVLDLLDTDQVAVMCSESLWWRCHRRLVADAATLARERGVRHLMHSGRLEPHRVTEGARLNADGLVVYDGVLGT